MQQENSEPVLYQGKAFTTWKQAFETIESRAKQQGFNIIYSRVEKKSDGTFRRRTAQCEHHGNYVTKSNKETTTKRLGCAWHINLSEPTSKNPFKYRRQMAENKKYQLVLWKAAIPCMPTQISTAAFMFTSINQKLEEYLPPAILELQRDEIRQCVFYNAVQVTQEVIDEFDKYDLLLGQYLEDVSDARQITAAYIQLYGKIAGLSHKATMKAVSKRDIRIIHILENYLKDVDEEQDEEQNENIELEDTKDDESDKENFPFILNNPNKQTRSKGRPKGTKRIKASHEKEKATTSVNSKQYKCGNCGDMGHNKRNFVLVTLAVSSLSGELHPYESKKEKKPLIHFKDYYIVHTPLAHITPTEVK
ncbi:11343_t:CDS:2, partial [Rhizophagus irregularis]